MRARLTTLTRQRLFWPAAVLVLLLLSNLIFTPGFFRVEVREGQLYGSLIDILRFGAPLVMVALGMTLVIATGGIDLSVGSVVAISGALACFLISRQGDQNSASGVVLAIALALVLALALGLWNGFLVVGLGIQPIVATLILMVAGRGLAQLITSGQIITINSKPYERIGEGYLATIPIAVLIAVAVTVAAVLLTRRSALGMLIESVGGNAEASRLSGIKARQIKLMVYVFCGLCAGIAGIMVSSNVHSADGNNAGLFIELDAILAVVIGGTSLAGGRFSFGGTVLGALIIQALSTTIYTVGVPPEITLLVKALVVTAVCLIQSPAFRAKVFRRRTRPPSPPPTVPADQPRVEVPA
jgi:simple sugar transport system permease protein